MGNQDETLRKCRLGFAEEKLSREDAVAMMERRWWQQLGGCLRLISPTRELRPQGAFPELRILKVPIRTSPLASLQ